MQYDLVTATDFSGRIKPWTFATYAQEWHDVRDAMSAVTATLLTSRPIQFYCRNRILHIVAEYDDRYLSGTMDTFDEREVMDLDDVVRIVRNTPQKVQELQRRPERLLLTHDPPQEEQLFRVDARNNVPTEGSTYVRARDMRTAIEKVEADLRGHHATLLEIAPNQLDWDAVKASSWVVVHAEPADD